MNSAVIGLTKWCRGCQRDKPLSAFHNNRCAKDGKQSKCKACQAEHARANSAACRKNQRLYRERHGERLRQQTRAKVLKDWYDLTLDQFDQLLASQGDVCASCGGNDLGNGNWHVDHDHACCPSKFTCGQCIRGILCPRCNRAIGMFEDNPDLMHAAAAYVIRAKSKPVAPGQSSRPPSGQSKGNKT